MLSLQRVLQCGARINRFGSAAAPVRTLHSSVALCLKQSSVLSGQYNSRQRSSSQSDTRGQYRSRKSFENRSNYSPRGNKGRYENDNLASPVFKSNSFNVTTLDPESFKEEVSIDSLLNEDLLHKHLHSAIKSMGFDSLTPVQQRTIKPILTTENDVVAKAKTGTGKTLAFLVPLFQHLIKTRLESPTAVKAVIVAPTRDLAIQISSEIQKLHEANKSLKSFRALTLIGGTNLDRSLQQLKNSKPNIIVGTPGRINDVLNRVGTHFFQNVDFKVLDEADTLLQIGFQTELSQISQTLNQLNSHGEDHIRTLLFSATMDHNVQELASTIMNKKECLFIDTVDKNDSEAHDRIAQKLVITKDFADSMIGLIETIQNELQKKPNFKAILFLPTVRFVDFFADVLDDSLKSNIDIIKFHGKIDQRRRTRLVDQFKRTKHGIFVCTDVGARGMHFPAVEHVYQLGVPTRLPNYIHRIGRTARAGNEGAATIFLFKDELKFVDQLKRTTNVTIEDQEDYLRNDQERWTSIASIITGNHDFSEALKTIIGFYKGIQNEYGFNNKVARTVLRSFSELHGDPDALLTFRSSELNNFFANRDMRQISDLIKVNSDRSRERRDFDEDDSRFQQKSNNRRDFSKSNRFDKTDNCRSRRPRNYQRNTFSFDD